MHGAASIAGGCVSCACLAGGTAQLEVCGAADVESTIIVAEFACLTALLPFRQLSSPEACLRVLALRQTSLEISPSGH